MFHAAQHCACQARRAAHAPGPTISSYRPTKPLPRFFMVEQQYANSMMKDAIVSSTNYVYSPCSMSMSLSILHAHVHSACLCPCFMTTVCSCCVHVHAACPCPSACPFHVLSMFHGHVLSMAHVHVHAACPCPWPPCMSKSMLHVHAHVDANPCLYAISMLHVLAARQCHLCMLYVHAHAAVHSMDRKVDMEHEHGHGQGHGHRHGHEHRHPHIGMYMTHTWT
jgi:hypothetical protein